MSRTVRLDTLWSLARRLSNTESDANILDAELTTLANLHYPSLYDQLIAAGPPDHFAASTTVNTVAGTIAYALTSSIKDLLEVHVAEGSTDRRPLMPMPDGARWRFKAPTAVNTVYLDYIPAATVLVNASDTIDGVSGYEEVIAALMARDVMVKREADPSIVLAIIERAQTRIRQMAKNRDRGQPKRITDTDDGWARWPDGVGSLSALSCYRLRGSNIELYESVAGGL